MVTGKWALKAAVVLGLLFSAVSSIEIWGSPCVRELTHRARSTAPLSPSRLDEVLKKLPEEKIAYFLDLIETLDWVTALKPQALRSFASGLRNFGYNAAERGRNALLNDLSPLFPEPISQNVRALVLALLNQFSEVPQLPPLQSDPLSALETFVWEQASPHLEKHVRDPALREKKLEFLRIYIPRFFRYGEYRWKMCLKNRHCEPLDLVERDFTYFASALYETAPQNAALLRDILTASFVGQGCALSGEKLKSKWIGDLQEEIHRVADLVPKNPSSNSAPARSIRPSESIAVVQERLAPSPSHPSAGRSRNRLKKTAGGDAAGVQKQAPLEASPSLPPLTPEIRAALIQAAEQIRPDHPAPFAPTVRLLTRILGEGRQNGTSHVIFSSPLSERKMLILIHHGKELTRAVTNDVVEVVQKLREAYGMDENP